MFKLFNLGAAWKHVAVFLFDFFKISDSIFHQMSKIVFDLFYLFCDFAQLFLVLFNVKSGNAADRQCQQFINVVLGNIAQQLFPERSKSVQHLFVFLFNTCALFNAFVDAVFKEYLGKGFGMTQLVETLELDLKLAFDISEEFLNIAFQNLSNTHLHRFMVADDHKFRRHPHRTIGIHEKSLKYLFRILSFGRSYPDFHQF